MASYCEDILRNGFEKMTIVQPYDYEGEVICTLIRRKARLHSDRAVLYLHGFNDYFFQQEMADQFNNHGYNFYALDLRKYGRSWLPHQTFNNVRNLEEYFEDIDAAIQAIKSEGNSYLLLSGHSTGGLTAALYASSRGKKSAVNAMFLNSPFFNLNMNKFLREVLLPFTLKLNRNFPDKKVKGGFLSLYGESLHKDYYGSWNYNLNWKPNVSPGFNYGWLQAVRRGQNSINKGLYLHCPVLVMHSVKTIRVKKWSVELFYGDAILNVEDIKKGASQLKGRISVVEVPSGMHDLVLSVKPVREQVYHTLFQWLKQCHSNHHDQM